MMTVLILFGVLINAFMQVAYAGAGPGPGPGPPGPPPIFPCAGAGRLDYRMARCNFTTPSINNLGGFCSPPGTCNDTTPEEIRFENACVLNGMSIDAVLRVAPLTIYSPIPAKTPTTPNTGGVNNNGVLGTLGQVNLRNSERVDLRLSFETSTGRPVILSGQMVFVNLNNGKCSCNPTPDRFECNDCSSCDGGRMFVTVPRFQVNGMFRPPIPWDRRDFILPRRTTTLCRQGSFARVQFASTTQGSPIGGEDNPTEIGNEVWFDTDELTEAQKNAGFGFIFPPLPQLRFTWEIRDGDISFGRNLVFGLNVHDCPTFGPTPQPTVL
mmetsp:Transcript_10209/g.11765  ORF Transcript_10209/g.11765 Transcript_10209/m.11765 type:complete len:325 (+) Transcript_10209:134-1108(+)